ncbi:MAG: response regulator [Alphaproteobacteria bacterium]|nr:response regulator [Alphaproteobacteria bacterium]
MNPETVKVLIVDDHMLMRSMVENYCVGLGITQIKECSGGQQALTLARSQDYDLILMDWGMPDMPGVEVLKKLRADKRFDKTAIVMVTAESEDSRLLEALEAGATSYLVKPFTQEEFEKKVRNTLEWLVKQRA